MSLRPTGWKFDRATAAGYKFNPYLLMIGDFPNGHQETHV